MAKVLTQEQTKDQVLIEPILSYRLPNYDVAIMELIRDVNHGLDKIHPILGEIRNIPVMHSGKTRQISEPVVIDTEMKKHSVDLSVDLGMYRTTNVEEFVDVLRRLVDELAEQKTKEVLSLLCQTTEATGNTVDGRDKNIWDAQIEMLESLEITFDRDGGHNLKLYAHPDMKEKMLATPITDEQQKRLEEVLVTKREAFDAKKRSRRLS